MTTPATREAVVTVDDKDYKAEATTTTKSADDVSQAVETEAVATTTTTEATTGTAQIEIQPADSQTAQTDSVADNSQTDANSTADTSDSTVSTDNTAATNAVVSEISKEATVDHADIYSEDTGYVYYTVYTTDGHVYSVSYNKSTGLMNIDKY